METMPSLPQPFHYRKKRPVKLVFGVILVFLTLGGIVYAVSQVQISTNIATIQGVTNLLVLTEQTSTTVCPQISSSYPGNTGIINWGTLNPGQTVIEYICLFNAGPNQSTGNLIMSTDLSVTYGIISLSPTTGLANNVGSLYSLTWNVASNAPAGSVPNFTITIATTS